MASAPESRLDQPLLRARGDLTACPFARLIHQVFRQELTGRIALRTATEVIQIFLKDGCTVHIERLSSRSAPPQSLVNPANADGPNPSGSHGNESRAQLRASLVRLFSIRDGQFDVLQEAHAYVLDEPGGPPRRSVDPRGVLLAGLKSGYDEVRLRAELLPFREGRFRLLDLPEGYLQAMGFAKDDPVVDKLNQAPATLHEVKPLNGAAAATLLALHYAELLVRQPTESEIKPQAESAGSPKSVAPQPLAAGPESTPETTAMQSDVAARKAELAALFGRAQTANHFEILGLGLEATAEDVNKAYRAAVRRFHPDRIAGVGLSELRGQAETVLARITQAAETLSDDAKRSAYLGQLETCDDVHGASASASQSAEQFARAALRSEQAFMKGCADLNRGNFAGAQQAFTEAVRTSPQEAEYRAHLAWARYKASPGQQHTVATETVRIISEALSKRPSFAAGHLWCGLIHKVQGDVARAQEAFQLCLKADANCIEAARELRLFEIRKRRRSTVVPAAPAERAGWIKKLLSRNAQALPDQADSKHSFKNSS